MEGGRAHRAVRRRHRAALLALAGALAACSGGDEGGGTIKAWSDPVQISFDTGNVDAPAITSDANGNATAIFRDHDGTKWGAGVNRYTAGNGWGGPQLINTTAANSQLFSYDIAAAPSGLVVAAWSQVVGPSGSVYDTWTSRLPVGGTWSGAITLSATAGGDRGPRVAVDASGAATVIWEETNNVEAADASATGFWTAPYSIDNELTTVSGALSLATDPNGRRYAAWSQAVGSGISLFASWTDSAIAKSWHTELVDTLSPPALNPHIDVNAAGTAFLVWDQTEVAGQPIHIWARRRPDSDMIGAWEAPVRIDTDTGDDAKSPRVAVDGDGNALAVWRQSDGVRNSIWANRYVAGSGWGTAQLLETADDETSAPRIAMGQSGEAFAVWTRTEGRRRRVWSAHFVPGVGWGAPERLENDTAKDAYGATVAYSDSGNAFAAWALSDPANSGVSKTWASVYR